MTPPPPPSALASPPSATPPPPEWTPSAPVPGDGSSPTPADRPKLYGWEVPRIWTEPLRPLTEDTTTGFDCILFAETVLGVTLYPWQKWLLVHALELLPNGEYRFENVLVLVSRQNGKTLVMVILALWRMYFDRASLVIGTAQKLDTAKEAWAAALAMAESVPALRRRIERAVAGNNETSMLLRRSEDPVARPWEVPARYATAAANRRGGRGLSGDLVLLDELREHQDWDAWGAVTSTTMARERSMIWCFSNAGDQTSVVLRSLRKMALWAPGVHGGQEERDSQEWALELTGDDDEDDGDGLGDVDEAGVFIAEWSAIPGRSKWDRDSWCQANPSLGWSPGFTERKLRGKLKLPDHVCRPENLCEWVGAAGLGLFGADNWARSADPASVIADHSDLHLCVDTSEKRDMTYLALAGRRPDGALTSTVIAQRVGLDWVVPWLKKRLKKGGTMHGRLRAVTLQSTGAPVSALIGQAENSLEALCEKHQVAFVPWAGADLARATGSAFDLLQGRRELVTDDSGKERMRVTDVLVYHQAQPVLDVAAAMARTKRAGDAFIIDRTGSPVDVAPLVAFVGALWLATHFQGAEPLVSAYEDADLEWA